MSTESSQQTAARVRFPPPAIFAVVMLIGYLLDRFVRRMPLDLGEPWTAIVGFALLAAGAVFLLGSLGQLVGSGQNPEPWKPTPSVVERGLYRVSRNPMYLGMALLQAAAACWKSQGWWWVLLPLSMWLAYRWAIRHEEAYLTERFGDPYREYQDRVRRWI